jgi:hypothetical protein
MSKKLETLISYPRAELKNEKLIFESPEGFDEALKEGVFYIRIPEDFNYGAANKFATSYYLPKNGVDDEYKGFKDVEFKESILGYSSPNDQVELLQLEAKLWHKYLPDGITSMLNQMNNISKIILKEVCDMIGVKSKDLDKITGGIDQDNALQYCIFNHYRSTKDAIGFTAHKDSGFITTLYSIEPGLEAFKNGQWYPIDPIPGYFTINLGHSFEILSAKMSKPIHAVYHRVRKTENISKNMPDRFSIGSYIGPRFDMDLYQYQHDGKLEFYQSFMDFQIAKAKEMNYEFHPNVK